MPGCLWCHTSTMPRARMRNWPGDHLNLHSQGHADSNWSVSDYREGAWLYSYNFGDFMHMQWFQCLLKCTVTYAMSIAGPQVLFYWQGIQPIDCIHTEGLIRAESGPCIDVRKPPQVLPRLDDGRGRGTRQATPGSDRPDHCAVLRWYQRGHRCVAWAHAWI